MDVESVLLSCADISAVALSVTVLVRQGSWSFGLPITTFIAYHLYANSFRWFSILLGSPLLYEDAPLIRDPVSLGEVQRAMLWCDYALVVVVCASALFTREKGMGRRGLLEGRKAGSALDNKTSVAIMLLLGLSGALVYFSSRSRSGVDFGGFEQSSYFYLMGLWPFSCLTIAIYIWGFRWYLMVPVFVYLGLAALQGYHRFMFVLPLVLFVNIYTIRRGLRWPPLSHCLVGIAILVMFPFMKDIGRAYQAGEYDRIGSIVLNYAPASIAGSIDVSPTFLDQFAGSMTLVDRYDGYFLGESYAALTVYPVPRVWWPEKPSITGPLEKIQTSRRPFKQEGRIVTWLGDAYMNFGVFGLICYPLIFAAALSWGTNLARSSGYGSWAHLVFVFSYPVMFQVWRDGLVSWAIFVFGHNLPMVILGVVQWTARNRGNFR